MAIAAFDDRDVLYGPLGDHYMRLGDTQFFIPPTSISVHRQMKHQRVSVIRGKNSLPKESGYFDRIITMTLFFPDVDSINYELRPILAQSKKSPFLPIENTYLNDAHKIEAITIQNVTVQTTPGFPNTLQAIIQCYAFEPATYIYGTSDRSFSEMFNWPMFRWYYERHLNETVVEDPVTSTLFKAMTKDQDSKVERSLTYFEPLDDDLTNDFMFKIVAEDDLDAIREWNKKKKELLKEWEKEQNDSSFGDWLDTRISEHGLQIGDEANEENFNKEYNELYKDAMFEYDLHYESWDLGSMELQDFSISFENSISSNQLQMHQSPTHQYLGSQDTVMVARFQTNDMESIASLEDLLRRTSYLTREYHKEVANGFLQIEHQIAQLYGVKNVVIDDVTVDTVDGMPGVYDVNLTLMAYNRAEKKMHEVKAMTLDINWDIDLVNNVPPFLKNLTSGFNKIKNSVGLQQDAQDQAIYNEWVMETFKAAELYPDLELPTYSEVQQAGFSLLNMNDGLFVDPDFFLNYDLERDFSFILNQTIAEGTGKVRLHDATGSTAELTPNGIELDQSAQEKSDKARTIFEAKPPKISVREGISKDPDEGNLPTDDMEVLIRKASSIYGLKAVYPLAFVKSFDPKMQQFYEMGLNRDLGGINVPSKTVPIRQDENLNYAQDMYHKYLGVMRVHIDYDERPIRPDNPSYTSVEYNVDLGIRYMKYYWEVARNIIDSNKNIDRIYTLFNLSTTSQEDQEKVHFIIMSLLYLRFNRELDQLLTKNTRLNATIVSKIRGMLKVLNDTEAWDYETLQSKYEELPVQDYKAIIEDGSGLEVLDELSKAKEEHFTAENTDLTEASMMTDMLKYDRRGRLVRAFPTFFMTFIDEGQFIGSVKMSDQYFHYRAVTDITYNNSRKQAASTLVCELSNVFGSLDDSEKAQDVTHSSFGDMFLAATLPGAVAKETERNRHRDPNYYKSIYLRTGVRVHMRMGYGSNALNLPTIMNGTITSLQNNGGTMTMIAQNDGIELTNKLNALLDIQPDDETSGFLSSKKEPTEIVDELLTDSDGFLANVSALLSNTEYQKHSLGLMHFGETGLPQGLQDFQDIFSLGLISGRDRAEINMNVYQTTGVLNEDHEKWYNKLQDGLGMGSTDEVNININLFDKTVWDVLNVVAAVGPDMVTAVHPFGLRNTIFLGKPYFPINYDYDVDLETESIKGTKVKSFKQLHFYDSYTSIISNQIKATEDNMYTVAVGTYMNEGKMNTTSPVYVDTDIWPEKQKTVNIDTTLNAKGVWALGAVPFIGDFLNKPAKWFFDEGVALKITAAGLRDYVKDMYDGYLTVMGDPSVKAYDSMILQDYYTNMSGPADVKEVVHIMNMDVGFITMIKPDVVCFNEDRTIYDYLTRAAVIGAYAASRMHIRSLLATRGYKGSVPLLNALWSSTTKRMGHMNQKVRGSKITKNAKDYYDRKVKGRIPPNVKATASKTAERIRQIPEVDIKRWKANGTFQDITKSLGNVSADDLEKIFKSGLDKASQTRLMRNFDSKKIDGLKGKASTVLRKGTKGTSSVLKGVGNIAKIASKGKHALLGPVGALTFIAETAAVSVLSSTVGELTERYLMNRQAVLIVPLKKDGVNFTAGINGNKGSVASEAEDMWQQYDGLTGVFVGMLGKLVGSSSESEGLEEFPELMSVMSAQSTEEIPEKELNESILKAIFNPTKVYADSGKIEEHYERDVKAAEEEIRGRAELLASRSSESNRPDYNIEEKNREADSILERVLAFFRGDDEEEASDFSGGVPLDGKAINLSKYFDRLGPMIEAEAKKQGLEKYAEILKAKCMQETGGNYIKYPDVFQASESLGLPRNSIGLEQSLTQGIKYFGQVVKKAGGDIKLALQSYNYGSGFIGYVKERGGQWTQALANSFSDMKAKQLGWSRYGDKNYIENVLRYYKAPKTSGGVSDAPAPSSGASSYQLTNSQAKKMLVDSRSQSGKSFSTTIVGGTALMRQGTYEMINQVAKDYKAQTGQKIVITSAYRPGDPRWHGTGYAVDVDTPNTMRRLSGGKLGFPNGKDKKDATKLVEIAVKAGFNEIIFGDWFIIEEMKRKYKNTRFIYESAQHHNHLHLSFPKKK